PATGIPQDFDSKKTYGGRACKPDSVGRTTFQQRAATIIPLAPASRPGSSDLPEGSSVPAACAVEKGAAALARSAQRAGPALPSYLVLHLAGFAVPRCCHRGGGLLPHLFTLTGEGSRWKMSRRFSSGLSPGCFAGGLFSVALSGTQLESTVRNDCATKNVPWRYQARCPIPAARRPQGFPR